MVLHVGAVVLGRPPCLAPRVAWGEVSRSDGEGPQGVMQARIVARFPRVVMPSPRRGNGTVSDKRDVEDAVPYGGGPTFSGG